MTGHRGLGLAIIVLACTSALPTSAQLAGAAIRAVAVPPAAISLVQKGSAGGGNGTSQAVTLSATRGGDLIAVAVKWCADSSCITTSSNAVSSVTDSTGDTCARAPGAAGNSNYTVVYEDVWYCQNISGGNETVTVNFSGSVYYHYVYLSEFSGVATSNPVEAGNSLALNPGSSPLYSMTQFYIPTAGNTSLSGDLIYSFIDAASPTPGQNVLNGPDEYQIAGAAGPYMNTWTLSSSPGSIVMGLAAFKAASGSGAPLSTNAVNYGAFSDAAPVGVFEASMEAFEAWVGQPVDSGYSIAFAPYSFDCVGGGSACMTNASSFIYDGHNYWFPASRQKLVWSIALTGCDHVINQNMSGQPLCSTGHTIPLTGPNSIASGFEDSVFDIVFSAIKSAWPNAIIRLGWEMNLNAGAWTWAVGGTGGNDVTGAAYVAAFQHVAAIAHSYGFRVDWCPGLGALSGPADNFYPGDAYVDIIGMDFYDSDGQDFPYYQAELYGLYWHAAFANLHHKPMAYDEWGCGGTASTDAHCANIVNGMASWMRQQPVAYFDFWNTGSSSLSKQICDNGIAGQCGPPYQNPLSAAAFLAKF
jgi:hypothetical protein